MGLVPRRGPAIPPSHPGPLGAAAPTRHRDEAAAELWRQYQIFKADPRFILENLSAFTEGRLAAAEEAWMTPGANRHARFYRKFHRALAGPSPLLEFVRAMQTPRSEAAVKAAATRFEIEQLQARAIAALKHLEAAETLEQRRYWSGQADELLDRITELEPRIPACQRPASQVEATQSAHDRVNQVREFIGKTLEGHNPETIPDQLWEALTDWNNHHQEWTPQQLDTAASRIHNIAFHTLAAHEQQNALHDDDPGGGEARTTTR